MRELHKDQRQGVLGSMLEAAHHNEKAGSVCPAKNGTPHSELFYSLK